MELDRYSNVWQVEMHLVFRLLGETPTEIISNASICQFVSHHPPHPPNPPNIPKIRPQIHHLPRPQPHQHPHRPKRKPLDPLVRALVRVPQFLLPRPQVLHLPHDLLHHLLDAPQLRLDRLQLLLRLDGRPVSRVGPDVDVQFDVSSWVEDGACALRQGLRDGGVGDIGEEGGGGRSGRTGSNELVLKADVKRGVRVGGERHPCLAGYVLGSAVLVADRVFDLCPPEISECSFFGVGRLVDGHAC